jgi:FixJ family two-component response regulator
MPHHLKTVYLVDDNPDIRWQLKELLMQHGFHVEVFESAADFLNHKTSSNPTVLVSDMRMPCMTGLELQRQLLATQRDIPMIFISGESHNQEIIDAMKGGAIEFLWKPFSGTQLLEAIHRGMHLSLQAQHHRIRSQRAKQRYQELSVREREILPYLLQGHGNKSIAASMDVLPDTVKKHRAQIMEKMQVENLPELIALWNGLDTPNALTRLSNDQRP